MFFEHEHLSLDLFTYRVPYEPFLHILTVFVKESVLNVRADLKVKKKNSALLYGDFRESSCKHCDAFNDVLVFDTFKIL